MKTLLAFAGGALLAGTIAFVAMHKGDAPEAAPQVAQVQQPAPAMEVPSPTPAAVAPAGVPVVAAPTPVPAARVVTPRTTAKPARVAPEPVQVEPAVASPAISPQPQSQAPVAPAIPAEPVAPPLNVEPPKPAFTPLKPKDPPKPAEPNSVTIAGGTTLSIRLAQGLDSSKLEQGQAFQATLDQPLVVDGFVVAERGAAVEGRVRDVAQAGRVKGLAHLAIELTRFTTSDGQRIPIRTAAWEKEGEKDTKGDATKVAVGAGIGAAIGAIFGGGKGAAVGAGSGGAAGAGTVLATRGKPVVLPAETRLSFRLQDPVTIIERR